MYTSHHVVPAPAYYLAYILIKWLQVSVTLKK